MNFSVEWESELRDRILSLDPFLFQIVVDHAARLASDPAKYGKSGAAPFYDADDHYLFTVHRRVFTLFYFRDDAAKVLRVVQMSVWPPLP